MKDRLFLNDCLIFQKDSFQIPRNFIELFLFPRSSSNSTTGRSFIIISQALTGRERCFQVTYDFVPSVKLVVNCHSVLFVSLDWQVNARESRERDC